VHGHATAGTGITYGVYGKSDSSSGYGVYSAGAARVEGDLTVASDLTVLGAAAITGDAHVEGSLTWGAKTGYVSISPAAFEPPNETQYFEQLGHTLSRYAFPGDDLISFVADVQLPHKATVTRFTVYWSWIQSGFTPTPSFDLARSPIEVSSVPVMATVEAYPEDVDVTLHSETTTISDPVVRNDLNWYFVIASLNGSIRLHGVIIEYEFSQPH
jgi:hypothetical protein